MDSQASHVESAIQDEAGATDSSEIIAELWIPPEVESSLAKLVYLYIGINPGAKPTGIAASLGITHLSLLPTLRTLVEADLLERDAGYRWVSSWNDRRNQ